jgi:hypothetical protein
MRKARKQRAKTEWLRLAPKYCQRGGGGAGVVGGEEQDEHEDQAGDAGGAHEDAEEEGESDGKFAVGNEEGDRCGVREDEIAEEGNHEGVGAAFGEEFVDPELKAAVQGEFSTEDLVLGEDEEEETDADAEESEGAGVLGVGGKRHGGMTNLALVVVGNKREKKKN